ncbi:MAG: hypothetical protein ACYDAO_07940 [Thermoplasmataceae archaeon]
MTIANEILKKLYEEEKVSTVDEMNRNGIITMALGNTMESF